MQGSEKSTPPPPWNAADTIRETTLICIDDLAQRQALRQVGRMIYDMAILTSEFPHDPSANHEALGAALAELRFIEGFFRSIRQSEEESDLEPEDARLARFAGKMAVQVSAIVAAVERELRPRGAGGEAIV